MISLEFVYVLMGAMLAGVAVVCARDRTSPRRFANTTFWGAYAITFLAGSKLPDVANGMLVLLMVGVVAFRGLGAAPAEEAGPVEREASARHWGNRLFIPALTIPAIALAGTFGFKALTWHREPLVDARQVTLVALAAGILAALVVGMAMIRPRWTVPIIEARRLLDAVSWAAVLPQMLAALGAMFALAGVGPIVATLIERWIPLNSPLSVVATYTLGMALFTAIMGNAFAAFPVMTAGIGLPLIVHQFGGDVVVMSAVGMLSGFCGTLTTPMAANFNIVPVALLELPDQNAVIKAQLPTAVLLLAANTAIMYAFVFRHR